MVRVIIELEFENSTTVDDADVYNYLKELMDNGYLGYTIK